MSNISTNLRRPTRAQRHRPGRHRNQPPPARRSLSRQSRHRQPHSHRPSRQHDRGRRHDSQHLDADESESAINRATRGLLVVGNRSALASQLEQSLLQAGALVLRTRVPVSPSLLTIARLGAVVHRRERRSRPHHAHRGEWLQHRSSTSSPSMQTPKRFSVNFNASQHFR